MGRSRSRTKGASVIEALLLAITVIGLLVAVGSLGAAVTADGIDGLALALPADSAAASSVPAGVIVEETLVRTRADIGLGFRLAWWATGPALGLAVAAGAYMLRKIATTAREGDPFVAPNVRRLRALALIAVLVGIIGYARAAVHIAVQAELGTETLSTTFSFLPFVPVVLLFGLASIWQRGVLLRDEQQLTV